VKKKNEDNQQREINFKDIYSKEGEDFIAWCLRAELLKKPSIAKVVETKQERSMLSDLSETKVIWINLFGNARIKIVEILKA